MEPARTWRTGENESEAGLTLIELIAALAIAALIAALAVGTLRWGRPGALTRNAAFDLVAVLRQARAQAQMSSKPHAVNLDLSAKRYAVEPRGASGSIPADMAIVVKTSTAEVVADDRASIRFYPDGSSSGGEIRLSQGLGVQIVRINWLSGRISVETAQTMAGEKP